MKIQRIFSKFMSVFTIIALVFVLVGPQITNAASLSGISDTMSREAQSTASTHLIKFKTPSAISASGTIAITFTSFTGTIASTDVQVCHGATGLENGTPTLTGGPTCGNNETINGTGGASTVWKAVGGVGTVTLTAPTGTMTYPIVANNFVTIYILATNITNPSSANSYAVSITNSNGDSGSTTVPILANDQIGVSASVNESLSFSINASTNNTGTATTVPLGTLTTAAPSGSNGTLPSIWANLSTNATGGMAVTVVSANGALKSTSTPADTIPSSTATMANGTANYGICIKSVTQTSGATLTKGTNFPSTTCTNTPAGNTVSAVTTSPQSLLTASSLISSGIAEIAVDAENNASTPAHTDYADTLTLIGTGTF